MVFAIFPPLLQAHIMYILKQFFVYFLYSFILSTIKRAFHLLFSLSPSHLCTLTHSQFNCSGGCSMCLCTCGSQSNDVFYYVFHIYSSIDYIYCFVKIQVIFMHINDAPMWRTFFDSTLYLYIYISYFICFAHTLTLTIYL